MLTSAILVGMRDMPPMLTPRTTSRTDTATRVRPSDLLSFARSPLRWSLEPDEPPPELADFPETLRMALLSPSTFAGNYTGRPSTYTAIVNTCPRCGSVGTGDVCKKDGTRRSGVSTQKPWTNAATACAQWTKQMQDAGRRIVPADVLSAAGLAVSALHEDDLYLSFVQEATTMLELEGVWYDEETGQDIPLGATVHIAPPAASVNGLKLGRVCTTGDASPATWALRNYHSLQHVRAALELALYNKAFDEDRNTYCWVAVEKSSPAVYARREAHPSLLAAGAQQLAGIMASFARCRATQVWPGFDGTYEQANATWSTFGIEPWMGSENGSLPMPFAVAACQGLAA